MHRPFSSFDSIDAFVDTRRIDRAERYQRSDRGFNDGGMRVASDRPSRVELWTPGAYVSWQKVRNGAVSSARAYATRMAALVPLKYRKYGPESHWKDRGSTFRPIRRQGSAATRRTGTTARIARHVQTNAALGSGTLESILFGGTITS